MENNINHNNVFDDFDESLSLFELLFKEELEVMKNHTIYEELK